MTQHSFAAELWVWAARREEGWTFVTVPPDISAAIEDESLARGARNGFGSVRVEVRLGGSTWQTSVFPDKASGCFLLPIKKAIRAAEGIGDGDPVQVSVRTV